MENGESLTKPKKASKTKFVLLLRKPKFSRGKRVSIRWVKNQFYMIFNVDYINLVPKPHLSSRV